MQPNKRTTALSLIGTIALCAAVYAFAADVQPIPSIWSPGEKQMAREQYLKDFHRIGLNTTPGDARFLSIMIEAAQCKRGVEVGTATGYGALLMGIAFERTGGHLTTIDIDPKMVVAAREHIEKMDLTDSVTVVEGDALKVLPDLEGKYDFLFLDALKKDYFNYFKAIAPKLTPGAVIIADNVIRFKDEMKDFLDAMENDPHFDIQIIQCSEEKGDGMAVIVKR
ncbi:MAG: class I SAM-dependent methyltransferase [Candidatus Hinthialibacter antarcticus]|nr:class I SAM-dependent methyltransferase [Candidatus Hinthialibacter antarcticus]